MKAVILAGGQGTRLRPMTENLPKPMVTVMGRPIMEHLVHHLRQHGFTDLLAALHHRPRVIRDHFGDGSELDVNMRYTLERTPLGTAGAVKLGGDFLDGTFLVIAGDALTDIDLSEFRVFHQAVGAKFSLCLKRAREPGEFGIVITDDTGTVLRFLESPAPGEVFSDTVSTGIYLIDAEILDKIPGDTPFDFASDLFPLLIAQKVPLHAHLTEGYWCDIDTLEQLKQAHWDFLDGKVQLPMPGSRTQTQVWVGEGTEIAQNVTLASPCWIGDNVCIRSGTKIGPYTVVSSDAEIEAHATLNRCIVMNNTFVGESCDLRNCIVGASNVLEAHCEIGEEVVIGPRCRFGRHVTALPGVLVWPDKTVDSNTVLRENLIWESLARPSIFGSGGISGLANLHITPEYAVVLGKAFGTWVQRGHRVAVARDAHPFSRLIKRAFVSGLAAVGVDVDDLEACSLPETRFITGFGRHSSGGAHIRISDEQSNLTVIELFGENGLPLPRSARRKIEAVFYRAEFPQVSVGGVGRLSYRGRVDQRYLEHLQERLKLHVLEQWNQRVLHFCQDGNLARILTTFLGSNGLPHLGSETGRSAAPYDRIAEIARLNRKIALIVQPAGDRLSLIDETGTLYGHERTQELLTAAFIIAAPVSEPVFVPPDHPRFLVDLADREVRVLIITYKEPAAQLQQLARRTEIRDTWLHLSHFYLGYDGVAAALKLLEFLGKQQMELHEFDRLIPTSHRRHLVSPCPWDQMARVMRELLQTPESRPDEVPEGVRLVMDGNWIYVLPSADAPQLEITLGAGTAAQLEPLEQEISRRIHTLL